MKLPFFFKFIVSVSFCSVLFSCSHTKKDTFPDPEIKVGTTKLSGKVINYHWKEGEKNPILTLAIFHLITAEVVHFETTLENDGSFSFKEIPTECNNTIGFIFSDIFNIGTDIGIGLVAGEESQVEIVYDENNNIPKIRSMKSSLLSVSDSLLYTYEFMDKFLAPTKDTHEKCYDLKPEEFRPYAMGIIKRRLEYGLDGSHFSKRAENYVLNEFKLLYLKGILLDYSGYISLNYQGFRTKGEPDNFTPQEPDKSYYSFLKNFDLNNPQYLYNPSSIEVLKTILRNDTLHIPPIDDIPVDQWMQEVKTIMSKLVGFDKGLFYDMLASNSYARQFNSEMKPLSDKQIENIKNYFKGKNGEIAKILLGKNDEIIKLAAQKDPLVVNETPIVSKEKLMDAIVSKYKGKVVVVDFWATWCAPCLRAMKEYRTVKGELKGKNVIFVYITNHSSPKKLWEEQIKGIGGEHYYLNEAEWEYILNSFDFSGIPTYLFYDLNGVLKNKVTAYPGTEKMKNMIMQLLPSVL